VVILNTKDRIKSITVPINGTIRDAMRAINEGALGVALLVEPEKGTFSGLITDGDIRRALLDGYGLQSSVSEVPRPTTKTAKIDTPLEELSDIFSEPVRVIPLLDYSNRVVDLALFDRRMRIPVAEPSLDEKELMYVTECVLSGWVSSAGSFVSRFEKLYGEFCGTNYAIATSSGTTALHLALLALQVGPGDEVILPTLTFIATANAVRYTGALPVFVDSELSTWNIDVEKIEEAITERTKAIIPVHLYGHPANMEVILGVARRHDLAVIEDAAQAHGARYRGKRVGGIGDMGVFSFYGNKIVTTGEGGMVATDDKEVADRIRMLRDHGMSPKRQYWHPILGYNYRMTNLQAALGVAQMEKIESILAAKRQIAQWYTNALSGVQGLILPPKAPWAENVYWLYSILIDSGVFGMKRDTAVKQLKREGIDTRPVFPPVHTQPIYESGQNFPIAERISSQGLSLPSSVSLTSSGVERVVAAIARLGHSGK
jgi:perosamine synthetase